MICNILEFTGRYVVYQSYDTIFGINTFCLLIYLKMRGIEGPFDPHTSTHPPIRTKFFETLKKLDMFRYFWKSTLIHQWHTNAKTVKWTLSGTAFAVSFGGQNTYVILYFKHLDQKPAEFSWLWAFTGPQTRATVISSKEYISISSLKF